MRITIGSEFRKYLKSNNYNQVFITEGRGMGSPAKCIFILSEEEWGRIKAKFAKLFVNKKKTLAAKFNDMFFKNTITMDMTKAKHIDIPCYLQKRVGIKQDVFVIGKDDRIEIWPKNKQRPVLNDGWVLLS